MTQDLVVRQSDEVGIFISPDIVLDNAMTAAKALMRVVSLKKEPVIMNGEQYLEYEDWQTCGQFYGYTVRTGDAVLVDIDGVKGAKAHADLINLRTGEVIGGAEAYCMRDEENWSTRPKYEWQGEGDNRKRVKVGEEIVPWFQLASMAQTRAGAKAFRNRLAWVVVLAGYRPTPAEEMIEGTVSERVKERRTVDKSDHYCELHGINFFKKGKMKSYGHPIGDTGQWCHEHKLEPVPEASKPPAESSVVTAQAEESPPASKPEAESQGKGEDKPALDLAWLKDSLTKLQGTVPKQWGTAMLICRMEKMYGIKGTDAVEMAQQLDKGKLAHFCKAIQESLDML